MPENSLRPINYDDAKKNVASYRPAFGVMYTPDSLLNYLQNIFPNIIEQQPEKPEGYEWSVGFYFYKLRSNISFYFAPVLKPSNPLLPVLDCFNKTDEEYFNTNIVDGDGNQAFIYNEGSLWP